jgi:hypothetical protein
VTSSKIVLSIQAFFKLIKKQSMDNIMLPLSKVVGKAVLTGILFLGYLSAIDAQTAPPAGGQATPEKTAQAAPYPHPRTIDGKPINIGIFYPISTNGREAKQYVNGLSLNLLVGVSAGETGFAGAGFSNVIVGDASCVEVAGFSNHIGGNARDVQAAGFMNIIRGNATGVQAAGFMNIIGRNGGMSVAGFGNFVRGDSSGVQVAGFINVAHDVHSQVAGFINVAKKVSGVQVAGFINIADSSEYPIGIINIIKNGEKEIGVSTDETLTTLVSFRSGSRTLYGIAGLGYNNKGSRQLAAWEAGVGAHLFVLENFRLNAEVVSVGLTDFEHGYYQRESFRLLPALRLTSHLEIFAGPSFNYAYCNKGQGKDLITHYLSSGNNSSGDFHGTYFGFIGGLQVRL